MRTPNEFRSYNAPVVIGEAQQRLNSRLLHIFHDLARKLHNGFI